MANYCSAAANVRMIEVMDYQVYDPHSDLAALVKCYWTLDVPYDASGEKQRIIPDGCIEMVFILGDDIRRYTSDEAYVIQPRTFILGQITKPYFIEPTGRVSSFAVRFYPYGFAGFVSVPLSELADKETPIAELFDPVQARKLSSDINEAADTGARIKIIEQFLLARIDDAYAINNLVKSTIDAILLTKGSTSIKAALQHDASKRRQLERNFLKQVGISPKQLGKVMRLQAAVKMMLEPSPAAMSAVAYNSDYYDQAHFVKDFKEFTGTTPKEFFTDGEMKLSSLFYES
jgi:AraC-like DNA-binding protein